MVYSFLKDLLPMRSLGCCQNELVILLESPSQCSQEDEKERDPTPDIPNATHSRCL